MPRLNAIVAALLLSITPLAALSASDVLQELFDKPVPSQGATVSTADRYQAPVKIDAQKLFTMNPNSQLKLSLQGFDPYKVIFDQAVNIDSNVREWRGHLEGKDELRVILRINSQGLASGYVQTPKMNLNVTYENGTHWLKSDVVATATPNKRAVASAPPVFAVPTTQKPIKIAGLPAKGVYETNIDIGALSSMRENTEISITLPNAGTYRVLYENTDTNSAGSSTWVGYLTEHGNSYRMMLTYNAHGAEGRVLTPQGEFQIHTVGTKQYIVDVKEAGLTQPPLNGSDAQIPDIAVGKGSSAGIPSIASGKVSSAGTPTTSSAAQVLTPSKAQAAEVAAPPSTVDVLILYTPGFIKRAGSDGKAQLRIDQLAALSNQAYKDSGIAMKLRIVGRELINYSDNTTSVRLKMGVFR